MALWISLAIAFFFEEVITTTGVLAIAHQQGLPYLGIHTLWFVVVVSETIAICALGVWSRKWLLKTRFGNWLNKYFELFGNMAGTYGKNLTLAIVAFLFSPGLSALSSVWLGVPFWAGVSIVVFCDFLWYMFEWSVVLGAAQLGGGFEVTLGAALFVALLITVGVHILRKKLTQ